MTAKTATRSRLHRVARMLRCTELCNRPVCDSDLAVVSARIVCTATKPNSADAGSARAAQREHPASGPARHSRLCGVAQKNGRWDQRNRPISARDVPPGDCQLASSFLPPDRTQRALLMCRATVKGMCFRMTADAPQTERSHSPFAAANENYSGRSYGVEKLKSMYFRNFRDYVFSKLWLGRSDPEWINLLHADLCPRTRDALRKLKGEADEAQRRGAPRSDHREGQTYTNYRANTHQLQRKLKEWIYAVDQVSAARGEPTKGEQRRLRAIVSTLVRAIAEHRRVVLDAEEPEPCPEDLRLWAVLDNVHWTPLANGQKLPITHVVENDWWVSPPPPWGQKQAAEPIELTGPAGSGADTEGQSNRDDSQ